MYRGRSGRVGRELRHEAYWKQLFLGNASPLCYNLINKPIINTVLHNFNWRPFEIIYSDMFWLLNAIFFLFLYIQPKDGFQEPKYVTVNYLKWSLIKNCVILYLVLLNLLEAAIWISYRGRLVTQYGPEICRFELCVHYDTVLLLTWVVWFIPKYCKFRKHADWKHSGFSSDSTHSRA
jgi:hypothetical protein